MNTANRRDIARKISENTGYYIQDVEEILQAETEAISELIDEGYTKIKNHKYMQLEVIERKGKKAWDGLNKEYFMLPNRKVIKFKPLKDLEEVIKNLNKED
ncbi:DNA binding protein [Staphylococcus phage CF5]|uniref:DNA binding protein n=1 Tax=Staphylococcus phage CF5 TaxID=3113739 RepID=A0AAX4J7I5_9CAUD|nr:DNA binding protein [Staphylococcus phage CF5]